MYKREFEYIHNGIMYIIMVYNGKKLNTYTIVL